MERTYSDKYKNNITYQNYIKNLVSEVLAAKAANTIDSKPKLSKVEYNNILMAYNVKGSEYNNDFIKELNDQTLSMGKTPT